MSYQLGLTFQPYVAAASSEHDEHPASYVTSLTKPHRPWWATDADATPTFTIDQGAATALAALYIDGATFPTALMETSPDASSWTSQGTISIPFDPQLADDLEPRRHAIIPLSGTWPRYTRLTPSAPDAGAPAVSIGVIALIPTLTTLTVNFSEGGGWERREPVTHLPYLNGGGETHRNGRPYMAAQFSGDPWPFASRDQLRSILAVGVGRPFLIYENAADPTQAYLVKRMNDVRVPREFKQIHFTLELETFG